MVEHTEVRYCSYVCPGVNPSNGLACSGTVSHPLPVHICEMELSIVLRFVREVGLGMDT